MSGKLFAFNVSKPIKQAAEEALDQWVGDQTPRAYCWPCHCSGGQGYGMSACYFLGSDNCYTSNDSGYYICDYPGS